LPKPHTGAETGETGEGGLAPSKRQVQRRRNGCEGGGTISRAERAKTIFWPPPLAYLGGHETGYCSFIYCNYDVWFRL